MATVICPPGSSRHERRSARLPFLPSLRDAAGRLYVAPLNALPAPAPSGVGVVERVLDADSGCLILRTLCALPAGAVFDPRVHGHSSRLLGDVPLVTLFVRA